MAVQKSKPPRILVLSLINRRASNTVLEGSEEEGAPIVLDCPAVRRVLPTSQMIRNDNVVAIRYIKGCPTIIRSEQDQKGYKANPQMDRIEFINGALTVVETPATRALQEYLLAAAYCEDAPGRPTDMDSPPIYREIKTEVIANNTLERKELMATAMSLVLSLRQKNDNGEGYSYDTNRINFLTILFGMHGVESPGEKLAALVTLAESRPEWFLDSLANVTAEVRVEVTQATQLGVLSIAERKATFIKQGKVFLKFRSNDVDQQLNELVTYLLSEEGSPYYSTMQIELAAAKESAAGAD